MKGYFLINDNGDDTISVGYSETKEILLALLDELKEEHINLRFHEKLNRESKWEQVMIDKAKI